MELCRWNEGCDLEQRRAASEAGRWQVHQAALGMLGARDAGGDGCDTGDGGAMWRGRALPTERGFSGDGGQTLTGAQEAGLSW